VALGRNKTLGLGAVFAVIVGAAYFLSRPEPSLPLPEGSPASPSAPPVFAGRLQAPSGTLSGVAKPQPESTADDWPQRLREAQERLGNYKRFARYPPGSRPAREHPDQMTPFLPVVRQSPLILHGEANEDVRIQLGQDRRELVADEAAKLWVRCEDSQGKVLPCKVAQATAMPAPPSDSKLPPVSLSFSDDGQNGDEHAQDGTLTTSFQPSLLGFRSFHGTMRVQVQLALGKEQGSALFDLLYTPTAPARFTGTVKESRADGSLQFVLGLSVQKAGRYFVVGRVDDQKERQIGYLQWEGELAPGNQTVSLTVFGKLIYDERPEFPLRLRDVEGFLFLEDSAPDRMHMPRLMGVVHKSQVYSVADFADTEWDGEMKRRYLDEYSKDVERAEKRDPNLP